MKYWADCGVPVSPPSDTESDINISKQCTGIKTGSWKLVEWSPDSDVAFVCCLDIVVSAYLIANG